MPVCIIRYQIDPFQKDDFRKHGQISSRSCRGSAVISSPSCCRTKARTMSPRALVGFDSMSDYEAYRTRIKADPEGREDAEWTARKRLILREERNFVEVVDGTFNLPSTFVNSHSSTGSETSTASAS